MHFYLKNFFYLFQDDKTIKIWDIDQGNCLSTLENDSRVSKLILISNNTQIACGSSNGAISIWNIGIIKII